MKDTVGTRLGSALADGPSDGSTEGIGETDCLNETEGEKLA